MYLIVAPHSHCESAIRDCDVVALEAARIMEKELPSDTISIVADRLRSKGDYNRPVTNTTPWRQWVRQIAKKHKPRFVAEVHSFPGWHNMYRKQWGRSRVVLFWSPWNSHFINDLAAAIRHQGVDYVKVARPWHDVAITNDLAMHYPHALIEFNEDNPSDLQHNATAVARAIKDFDFPPPLRVPPLAVIVVGLMVLIVVILLVAALIGHDSRRSAAIASANWLDPQGAPPLHQSYVPMFR